MAFALEDFEKQEPSNPAATGGEDRKRSGVGGKLEIQNRSWQLASDVLARRHAAREAKWNGAWRRGVNGIERQHEQPTRPARIARTTVASDAERASVSARNFNAPLRRCRLGSWILEILLESRFYR
jgi:hypothetical protein